MPSNTLKEKSWSMIDPRPVLKYIPRCDDYIVYWNGIVMPHKMALIIGMQLLNIFPTPEMKRAANENYKKLYFSNAFGDESKEWVNLVNNNKNTSTIYNIVLKSIQKHITSLKEKNYSGKEVLGWFDYSRAITD
jgi:hypothetical protein